MEETTMSITLTLLKLEIIGFHVKSILYLKTRVTNIIQKLLIFILYKISSFDKFSVLVFY